jgi:hypothetical protein
MSGEDRAIAELAYLLWESRGRPADSAEQDWLEAEAQLAARKGTAPASSLIPASSVSKEIPKVPMDRRKSRASRASD